ncbi:hypothetical protein SAMN02745170_00796 [Propionispora hippei DSM 15287]|uniref:Uncharacterized protein n=1 Tax=Propionispora hippei DSM 15287 TaxID=1123003 RepID=A0A1M6CZS0_9FIRM|nr:hypothetical protein SAMN02745170_00796 [Propionispora hippei DSM 15287]
MVKFFEIVVDIQEFPCEFVRNAPSDNEKTMQVVPLMLAGFLFYALCDKIRADYAGYKQVN